MAQVQTYSSSDEVEEALKVIMAKMGENKSEVIRRLALAELARVAAFGPISTEEELGRL